ncbi:MAG: hypothetical protein KDD40_02830 [Bdellovibrionales bacterium]|nr:hypothetical protein [Bdellovibrionales bacterium]
MSNIPNPLVFKALIGFIFLICFSSFGQAKIEPSLKFSVQADGEKQLYFVELVNSTEVPSEPSKKKNYYDWIQEILKQLEVEACYKPLDATDFEGLSTRPLSRVNFEIEVDRQQGRIDDLVRERKDYFTMYGFVITAELGNIENDVSQAQGKLSELQETKRWCDELESRSVLVSIETDIYQLSRQVKGTLGQNVSIKSLELKEIDSSSMLEAF